MKSGFSQEAAFSDTTNPIKIGPLIDELPMLDTLQLVRTDTVGDTIIIQKKSITDQYPLNASGSFFRGINFGGNGINKLNLSRNYQVISGTLCTYVWIIMLSLWITLLVTYFCLDI